MSSGDKTNTIKLSSKIKNNIEFYKKTNNIIVFHNSELNSTGFYADYFIHKYPKNFIYNSNKLYHFNNVYWKIDDNKSIINNFIDTIMYKDIQTELSKYNDYLQDYLQDDNKKSLEHWANVSKYRQTAQKLRNIKFRIDLIKDIQFKLNNDDIIFDNKPYLYAFNNKIFNIQTGEIIKPNYEDYISITTGYDYTDKNIDELKIQLNKIIDTIFKQEDIKKLYLTLLSTGLSGIPLEKFIIANGSGGNGKGLLNELTEIMMGNYCYILPSQILLQNIKTGANVEIFNMNKKRLVITREPDDEQLLNCSTIKEICGGNNINARDLYSSNTKTTLNLTLIMECNKKPKLSETTDAMARRILDIPFKSKFVDKCNYDKMNEKQKEGVYIINQYYKTNDFKEKYKIALFHILLEHHIEYCKNDNILPMTDEIIQRNNDYLKNSNEMINFMLDNYIITDNENDKITLKDIYNKYKYSDLYCNLSKLKKRASSFKNFILEIQENTYLKNFIIQIQDKYYLTNIIEQIIENNTTTNTTTTTNKTKDIYDDNDDIDKEELNKREKFLNNINKVNKHGLDT